MFLDHNMKLYKMIEICLKYDNMHTFGIINAFICINNHVNLCINSMLSEAIHLNSFKNSLKRNLVSMFSHTYEIIGSYILGASMF